MAEPTVEFVSGSIIDGKRRTTMAIMLNQRAVVKVSQPVPRNYEHHHFSNEECEYLARREAVPVSELLYVLSWANLLRYNKKLDGDGFELGYDYPHTPALYVFLETILNKYVPDNSKETKPVRPKLGTVAKSELQSLMGELKDETSRETSIQKLDAFVTKYRR